MMLIDDSVCTKSTNRRSKNMPEKEKYPMLRKASILIAAVGFSVAVGQSAFASDLPMRQPTYKPAPMLAPTPVYSWTGFYVGGNIGGSWATLDVTNVGNGINSAPNASGFTGGGQIGYDYQMGQWVIGVRNQFNGSNMSKNLTVTAPNFGGTVNSHVNWTDTLTARAGFLVQPNLLLYAQGGAAWTGWDVTFNNGGAQVGEISNSKTGWTAGAGAEWMFLPHWTAFLEYNYMGFGTFSNAVTTCIGATCGTFSGKGDIQNVLAGVNYRF
jgi:outer membrane immunogenic protein